MIKVIASDMDGTLLGDDHRIAPGTLEAVKEAVNAGIRFMICTGRNFPGAMGTTCVLVLLAVLLFFCFRKIIKSYVCS